MALLGSRGLERRRRMATNVDIIERALSSVQREHKERLYQRFVRNVKTPKPDTSALAPEHYQAFELGHAQAIEHTLTEIDEASGKNKMPF